MVNGNAIVSLSHRHGHNFDELNALAATMAISSARSTPEQKQQWKEEKEAWELARKKKEQILKNICPDCEGKLVRGKKDKRFDYKRIWDCISCSNRYKDDGNPV